MRRNKNDIKLQILVKEPAKSTSYNTLLKIC